VALAPIAHSSLGVYAASFMIDGWMDDRYYPEIPEWCTLYDARIIDMYRFTDADGMPEGL
jgi:hypothetical protein